MGLPCNSLFINSLEQVMVYGTAAEKEALHKAGPEF